MINQCPECGGQNANHFQSCQHANAMPRVSALRTALPRPTAPGKLPYMHQQQATGHEAIYRSPPTTGRQNMSYPQIQNFPGTLAAALEMHEAMYGPIATEYRIIPRPESEPKEDPSIRLSTCPAKEETLTMKASAIARAGDFTHRHKGGRYHIYGISKPAGEVMRRIGVTVIYYDVHTRQLYCRDLEDFVHIMVPIPD